MTPEYMAKLDQVVVDELIDLERQRNALAAELAEVNRHANRWRDAYNSERARCAALESDRDQVSLALDLARVDRDKWFNRARELGAALDDVLPLLAECDCIYSDRKEPLCPCRAARALVTPAETKCEGALTCPVCGMKSCNCRPGYIP